ncbi:MAG: 3-deoxy-7-phosphoheptulonate synthase [Candidatus Riflebacteria bacterium]|nr:3-deoxy-7-phosphoheptulonate synthase [Candidatus Riflebacteria bacterium]
MIILMAPWATEKHVSDLRKHIINSGMSASVLENAGRKLIAVSLCGGPLFEKSFETWPGVEQTFPIIQPFMLASREFNPENTLIQLKMKKSPGVKPAIFGGNDVQIIAGPCAVEDEKSCMEIAEKVKEAGCNIFRGGVFKARTSPYAFQGLGKKGLKILEKIKKQFGMFIVTEVLDSSEIPPTIEVADVLQIGTRNMTNFRLLESLGKFDKPILLKRGMSSTIREFLMAAEYILKNGNPNVILCERGIRTFETHTRFTMDINAFPAIKQISHLPIIADPSHATGSWRLVESVSLAAVAAGADGLLIEVHTDPKNALSDGVQSILPERLPALIKKVRAIKNILIEE